jgi:hypothetical protein
VERPDLHEALRAWLRAALEFARETGGFTRGQTDTWVRGLRGNVPSFERDTWQRIVYHEACAVDMIRLREFGIVVAALARDEHLGPLWNQYVGTARGFGAMFDANALRSLFLPVDADPRRPREDLAFDEAEFERKFESLVAFGREETVPMCYMYPLVGFIAEAPLEIEPGLTIRRMNDDELVNALHWGILPTHVNQFKFHDDDAASAFAVFREFEEPRIVSPARPEIRNAPARFGDERGNIEQCLALATDGDVRVCSTMYYSTHGWPFGINSVFQPTSVSDERGRRNARVAAADAALFSSIWNALQTAWPGYSLAARRFYQACLRNNAVDSLLDDMIAAEAVLLPNVTVELSYRFSTNAAHYFDTANEHERRAVFEFYKEAYNARSSIAHGEDPRKLQPRIGGVPSALGLFELAFRASLRALLRLMVARGDSKRAISWIDTVVGKKVQP